MYMTTTQPQFDPMLVRTSYDSIIVAYANHNYKQTIDLSTKSIASIQQYQLVSFLNIRACAYGIKGYFNKAIQDAKEIIKYAPEWGIGYLRLGNLLHMQGKQSAAIILYEEALTKISKQDPDYKQLVQEKKKAEEKNEKHVDIITMLPVELVYDIFQYLPETTKAVACIDVSKGWRKKISQSQVLWKTLSDNFDECDNESVVLISRLVPHIAHHVKNVTISMENKKVGDTYLEYMEKGHFEKIKNLTLTGEAVECISYMNTLKSFTNALWQMRNTLTKLDITSTDYKDSKIRISDLLFYCKNLQTLVMNIDCPLDAFIGEMENLAGPYNTLIDVELTTSCTTGQVLKPLLQYCPKIRRLCLKGCTPDVVDIVDELYNDNLEIFAYNPSFEVTSLEEKDDEFYDGPPGLREIYTSNGGYGPQTDSFLRLLRKNQKSLQTVYANTHMTEEQEDRGEPYPNFIPVYEEWYFERLQHLTYWPDVYNVTESMFLQSIKLCTSTSLLLFSAVCTPNIPMIADRLMKLPPVENIELTLIKYDDGNEYLRSSAMIQLFNYYAAFSPLDQTFSKIWFEYCDFITDDVLDSLTHIKTIKRVYFSGTCTVPSHKHFLAFLRKMSHQLTEVMFVDIDHIGDDVLNLLCKMEHLETITLELITEITEEGIKHLADNTRRLCSLKIDNCIELSYDTVSYINKKIKSVVYITEEP
ncbi:hypothetical protein INT45_002991 [Circinella minor]|uniref:F-box domain-containing protein n=1 Tax=Circinella minor TaxID=1195481 RepID=A0A8H7RHE5_9FUNG|nr:hypothetical protein INT45_002991 [Circinella minor]